MSDKSILYVDRHPEDGSVELYPIRSSPYGGMLYVHDNIEGSQETRRTLSLPPAQAEDLWVRLGRILGKEVPDRAAA